MFSYYGLWYQHTCQHFVKNKKWDFFLMGINQIKKNVFRIDKATHFRQKWNASSSFTTIFTK